MSSLDLKSVRRAKGLTQVDAARRLGVSQGYVAMLERGKRRLTPRLARQVMKVYGAPPTVVPPSRTPAESCSRDELAKDLAALGYPGFAHMRDRRRDPKNPAQVLLAGLANDDLESRLVEALPWLLLRYSTVDRGWLVREAKVRDLQNRLGFVVSLARGVAERTGNDNQVRTLKELEGQLERSRLAREDTLCRESAPEPERRWLKQNQPEEAKRWNVLTDWTPDALRYAGSTSALA